ncbi:MAG: hypothetical protein KDA97_00950 [Acidimicrobiales bacterium]|nr:hypothetical protein [Acidimicrobiales bacterium]
MDKRRALVGGGLATLLVLVLAIGWFGPFDHGEGDDAPDLDEATAAADRFADAWAAGELPSVAATEGSGDIDQQTLVVVADLVPVTGGTPATVTVGEVAEVVDTAEGDDAPRRVRADLEVSWDLGDERSWSYDTAVELVEDVAVEGADPAWLVDWTSKVVHPQLRPGDVFGVARLAASRGELLDASGEPLVGARPVVHVSLQPGASADPAAAARQVANLVGVSADSLVERVEAASPDTYVSVVTLREEDFAGVESSLRAIPGIGLREDEIPLAPSRTFARALLGSVGTATAEDVADSGGRVQEGDLVGQSGLQAAQDVALAGKPGISIRAVPTAGGEPVELASFDAEEGESLMLTLDADLQLAADEVMAGAPNPGALVAIRVSTGDVVAVANGPTGADGYNRAMVGSYPPGSTFKVSSTLTLLENGLDPDAIVSCPATIVVGREFSNAEGEVLGDVPFHVDFAHSCNTAFIDQSQTVTSEQVSETAARLGFREVDLGVPLATPSVPVDESPAAHSAQMIGQGKVQASPFTVALMSASVAAGRSLEPRLIIDPDDPEPVLGEELPAGPIAALQAMMREVVVDGTGSAVASVAGGEVHGKTGTAEFGTEDPPQTHAWFTGYQGDIAFAVVVEDSGFGGAVAAPLAAQFLNAIATP